MRADGTRSLAIGSAGWGAFLLIGWAGLLVPSLIREIEHAFGQSDAGIGTFYLVYSIAYAAGSVLGGGLTERVGRRVVLVSALVAQGAGLLVQGLVPEWTVFLVAAVPRGLGAGAIDGGIQGLFLDAFAPAATGPLNGVHVAFSLGSLVAPVGVGTLVAAGVPWQAVILGSGVASLALAAPFGVIDMPHGRHDRSGKQASLRIGLPLVAAGAALALYVASEVGLSSWLVRFLPASLPVATGALTLFWLGLTAGRVVAARYASRFDPVRLGVVACLAGGVAMALGVGAVAIGIGPAVATSIVLFTLAGFAFGPVYPIIILIADRLYPGRAAAVTGLLAGVAVVGSVGYPPLMGLISVSAGLVAAMFGAALLAVLAAGLLAFARAEARSAPP
ncbi:MAG TPA: MFS transporter [Candidatus Limnocylindrales bacterium]|nr:MFS transporter [Candidatus Limnocylindrales bacterium]